MRCAHGLASVALSVGICLLLAGCPQSPRRAADRAARQPDGSQEPVELSESEQIDLTMSTDFVSAAGETIAEIEEAVVELETIEVSPANDLDAAQVSTPELATLGDASLPKSDMLKQVGSHQGSGLGGANIKISEGRSGAQARGGSNGQQGGAQAQGSGQQQARLHQVEHLRQYTRELKKVQESADYMRAETQKELRADLIRRQVEHPLDEAAREAPELGVGEGPESGGDKFDRIYENEFQTVRDAPLSTFSIDVDTASYSKMRQYLNGGRLPPPDSVRIEELVNYFPYDYLGPMGDRPFTSHMEVSECPWQPEHRLARIAIKGREIQSGSRPVSNLVFLLDVSGSMNQANKLPLVKRGMEMLVDELGENDRVAIVVYAGAAGLVLPSTPGDEKATIKAALDKLHAGGSTAGAAGIKLAYETAHENFVEDGVNRVLLCTDGDFNVGASGTGDLVRLAEEHAKQNVFLSILGFGIGNLNDSMLEQVSGKANGMYAFIDTENEARKVLVEQLSGTLVTIAKDVKIQIEFNPAKVQGYRLIGYENRILAAEDFNDDQKDAGEIGAGHMVTALYQIVPVGAPPIFRERSVDDLKYQDQPKPNEKADSDELLTLKLRYKPPEGDTSTLISFPVDDSAQRFSEASDDFQFAASVASLGMLLRGSRYAGEATYDSVLEIAQESTGEDPWGYRKEFVALVERAKELK